MSFNDDHSPTSGGLSLADRKVLLTNCHNLTVRHPAQGAAILDYADSFAKLLNAGPADEHAVLAPV